MVNAMKTPQHRHFVGQDMPEIQRVIKQEHRYDHFEPGGALQVLYQSPLLAFDELRQRTGHRALDEPDSRGADCHHGQITYVPCELAFRLSPQRPSML